MRPILAPFAQLWGWPIVLGVLSATGLVSALVSEGWGDVWSWIALGAPVGVMGWLALPQRKPLTASSSPSPSPTRLHELASKSSRK